MTRIPIHRPAALFTLAGAALVGFAGGTPAQCERQKFVPAGATPSMGFGNSIDRDGDALIVGAKDETVHAAGSGAAYVYRWNGSLWVEEQRLIPPSGASGDNFGRSVAIDGDVAVIGEPLSGGNHGAVYVFERIAGVWTQVAKLDNGSTQQDFLGETVAIDGDVILVGVTSDELACGYYEPATGWVDTATPSFILTASDGGIAKNHDFGNQVEIQGDTIVVAADGWENGSGLINDGAVYVFEEPAGGWVTGTETARLNPATDQGGQCGWSLALDGDWIVAGAPIFDVDPGAGVVRSGVAYLFRKPAGSWVDATETQRVEPSDAGDLDRFGEDVTIEGDDLVCGASGEQGCYWYHFDGTTWTSKNKIEPADMFQVGQFGWSVVLAEGTLQSGAPTTDTTAGANSGAVFDFLLDPISATFTEYGTGALTLSGSIIGPCDDDLQIAITGATQPVVAFFLLTATAAGTGTMYGGFEFWVDLAQLLPVILLPAFDPNGDLVLTGSLPPGTPIGTTVYFQVLGKDASGKPWSNGLEMVVVP